ncbi:MAG: tellurium resistance protein TerC [Sulfurimonas sp.]|nr:tellurium resistance protein TerC [Sulfurimonas sp.]
MQGLVKLSGVLIFLSVLLTLYSYFLEPSYLVYAGLLLWCSFFILFRTLEKKKIVVFLFVFSILAFFISFINGYSIDIRKIFTINQNLITLLICVSFLRLIIAPEYDNTKMPKGKRSFFATYFNLYLFSSVLNISSLVLVADKLYKKSPLSKLEIILLTRSFASNAYWSPFFVSFAVVLTYAPDLNTSIVMLNGILFSLIAYLLTYYEVTKNKELKIDQFIGYPLSLNNLLLPSFLAFLVLVTNYFYPNIKVIVLISLFSLLLPLFVTIFTNNYLKSIEKIRSHILIELPKMKSEISLFLVAGMFGVSVSSILSGLDISLPFASSSFDWASASVLLLAFIFLGFVGIHPIISISIIGSYITQVDHTLLAVTFLMGWATNVSTSPFSGLNLTMASKYSVDTKEIFRLNILYSLKIYLMSIASLYILSKYLNL